MRGGSGGKREGKEGEGWESGRGFWGGRRMGVGEGEIMEDFGKGDGVGEVGEGWLRGKGGIVGCWGKR